MTTPVPVTVEEVRTFLDDLAKPTSLRDRLRRPSTRVANSLRRKGIRGYRVTSTSCPIAIALKRQFPGHYWSVGTTTIRDDVVLGTPGSIRRFVRRFDNYAFTDLDGSYDGLAEYGR